MSKAMVIRAFKSLLWISRELNQEDEENLYGIIEIFVDVLKKPKGKNRSKSFYRACKILWRVREQMRHKSYLISDAGAYFFGADQYGQIRNRSESYLIVRHRDLRKDMAMRGVMSDQAQESRGKFTKKRYMDEHSIPNEIFLALEENNLKSIESNGILGYENYIKHFENLLWLDEAYDAATTRRYDTENVIIDEFVEGERLVFPIPDILADSLFKSTGYFIILKCLTQDAFFEKIPYLKVSVEKISEGKIITKESELLRYDKVKGQLFSIQLWPPSIAFRRCHHALLSLGKESSRKVVELFPAKEVTQSAKPKIEISEKRTEELRCITGSLNDHQKRAVMNILVAQCRPAPFILFGPPGTGKTVTLVESILQVYARNKLSRILICSNSNAATDILAERLHVTGLVKDMIRLVSNARIVTAQINTRIGSICRSEDQILETGSDMLRDCRIIVTTCSQASCLERYGKTFDYVFIDEAGHVNEPESLIPINLLQEDGLVVLAGDPHQLGPVVICRHSKDRGLGASLLERLCQLPIYSRQKDNRKKESYDARYISKLVICYRSDPRVMIINNKIFYHDELKFGSRTPEKWLKLLKTEKPLNFYHVDGREMKDPTSSSWFNPHEAVVCLYFAKLLLSASVKPEHIGILTPYKRQIYKLGLLFQCFGRDRCKISTPEEFQGDERRFIIISMVRTCEKNSNHDPRHKLRFLFEPKRFNVAISRAKWIVIVVGDQRVLEYDYCWSEYLKVAHKMDRIDIHQ